MTGVSEESRRKFREWLQREIGKSWIRKRLHDKYLHDAE